MAQNPRKIMHMCCGGLSPGSRALAVNSRNFLSHTGNPPADVQKSEEQPREEGEQPQPPPGTHPGSQAESPQPLRWFEAALLGPTPPDQWDQWAPKPKSQSEESPHPGYLPGGRRFLRRRTLGSRTTTRRRTLGTRTTTV